jgi:SEC-C motif domain protein
MYPCLCGSGKLMPACCGPYLAGATAPTAEALMRSRYTAYATGRYDYIERTSAGPAATTFDRREAELSGLAIEWLGLEMGAREGGLVTDECGKVSFSFRIRQHGREALAKEVSLFRKIDGQWFYWDRADGAKAIGRNDPCPCGSGKKYKKCCGAG